MVQQVHLSDSSKDLYLPALQAHQSKKRRGATMPTGRVSDDTQAQIRRLMAERDLLLSAIAPEDYDKIKDKLVAVSESSDVPEGEIK
jgi:hypothetical protein